MKNQLLLPNKFKMIGWCILIPATIFLILLRIQDVNAFAINARVFAIATGDLNLGTHADVPRYFAFFNTNITPTLVGILFIIGALLVAFSREKSEDEFIANLRLSSLQWAVFVNYALLLLAFALVYGMDFLNVMVYNMFTVLIIFIIRFNYVLYRNNNLANDEK